MCFFIQSGFCTVQHGSAQHSAGRSVTQTSREIGTVIRRSSQRCRCAQNKPPVWQQWLPLQSGWIILWRLLPLHGGRLEPGEPLQQKVRSGGLSQRSREAQGPHRNTGTPPGPAAALQLGESRRCQAGNYEAGPKQVEFIGVLSLLICGVYSIIELQRCDLHW